VFLVLFCLTLGVSKNARVKDVVMQAENDPSVSNLKSFAQVVGEAFEGQPDNEIWIDAKKHADVVNMMLDDAETYENKPMEEAWMASALKGIDTSVTSNPDYSLVDLVSENPEVPTEASEIVKTLNEKLESFKNPQVPIWDIVGWTKNKREFELTEYISKLIENNQLEQGSREAAIAALDEVFRPYKKEYHELRIRREEGIETEVGHVRFDYVSRRMEEIESMRNKLQSSLSFGMKIKNALLPIFAALIALGSSDAALARSPSNYRDSNAGSGSKTVTGSGSGSETGSVSGTVSGSRSGSVSGSVSGSGSETGSGMFESLTTTIKETAKNAATSFTDAATAVTKAATKKAEEIAYGPPLPEREPLSLLDTSLITLAAMSPAFVWLGTTYFNSPQYEGPIALLILSAVAVQWLLEVLQDADSVENIRRTFVVVTGAEFGLGRWASATVFVRNLFPLMVTPKGFSFMAVGLASLLRYIVSMIYRVQPVVPYAGKNDDPGHTVPSNELAHAVLLNEGPVQSDETSTIKPYGSGATVTSKNDTVPYNLANGGEVLLGEVPVKTGVVPAAPNVKNPRRSRRLEGRR
jgi:hypothetical protein